MPSKKIPSLHHNLPFQDAYIGGPNVIFHRSHRAKKCQSIYKTTKKKEFLEHLEEKMEKYDEIEEKRYKTLDY
jgi:hypothetical protein